MNKLLQTRQMWCGSTQSEVVQRTAELEVGPECTVPILRKEEQVRCDIVLVSNTA